MADLERTSCDDLVIRDTEGNVLEALDVQVFDRDTTTLSDIFEEPTGGVTVAQPLITDERGHPRQDNGDEAWVIPGSYDVVLPGANAPLFHWEPTSGRGAIPVGPASGTAVSGEFPDAVVATAGGGGDVAAHAALAEGVHGIPSPMPDGHGLVWDESENNWDSVALVDANDLGTISKRQVGADTSFLATDIGGVIDVTAAATVTVPLDLFATAGAVVEVCRVGSGVVTCTIAVPGIFESAVSGTTTNSITINTRYGSAYFRLRIATSGANAWVVDGKIT